MKTLDQIIKPWVRQLSPYVPGKPVEELAREHQLTQIVKLASNENPFGPAPEVVDYLQQQTDWPELLARYPDGSGFYLKNKLSQLFEKDIEQITLGNGSNDILDIICRCFAGPEDEVIFSQYAFAVYPISTRAVGATAIVTPAYKYGHDLQAMLDAVSKRSKIIFIANPNNPTGTVLDAEDLYRFLEQVPRNIIVVIDEAYYEYASHPDAPCGRTYQGMHGALDDFENLIVTRTFSKAYGLAGLRVGYSFSSVPIAQVLNRIRQPFNVNTLALNAAQIALQAKKHTQQCVQKNWQGMRQIGDFFNKQGIAFIPSCGNFVCMNIEHVPPSLLAKAGIQTDWSNAQKSAALNQYFLSQGVIIRPISNYHLDSFLRISIGSKEENQRLIDVISS